ncbi:MAG: hypothetical protein D6766_06690 [Verrucomicrobia bacterium]|nr:MAG: hypothetical protein D6766_06690 [Verrucomicrobiota bacterium]
MLAAAWFGLAALMAASALGGAPGRQVVFYTGFEISEGYRSAESELPLRGQNGWLGSGSGGNGLVRDFFVGLGQQAYIGYLPPAPKDGYLVLWKPLDLPDPQPDRPIWRFSVLMQIVDSTNGQYDDFRWTFYNRDGIALFTTAFDNANTGIYFALDDSAEFYDTGFVFSNDAMYELEVILNFARNDWIARMNGVRIIDAQPISTNGVALNLGDVDAVWVAHDPQQPGDNYMLFDEYTVSVEPETVIPPVVEPLGFTDEGDFALLLHGERGVRYGVEATDDLRQWIRIGEPLLDEGWLVFTDPAANGRQHAFYRMVELP